VNQKGIAPILIVIGLVLTTLVGGVIYFTQTKSSTNQLSEPTPIPSTISINGWKTYTNNDWLVSFDHPATWEAKPMNDTYIEFVDSTAPEHSALYLGVQFINNPKNLSLEQIDQEMWNKEKKQGAALNSPSVNPVNYTTLTTKNGYQTFYEKEYFCEPAICDRYTIFGTNKIIQLIIFGALKNDPNHSRIYDQILYTFEFTPQTEQLSLWQPVCDALNLTNLQVPVSTGDGITHIARKAMLDYFNHVTLSNLNSTTPRLNAEEAVYAEDYIRKNTNINLSQKSVPLPCKVVEEATMKARQLTIDQQGNLQQYSQNVPEHQINDIIQQNLQNLPPELREHSGSINLID
jgi:hypothetical protein